MGSNPIVPTPAFKIGDSYGTFASRTAELAEKATRTTTEETDNGVFIRYFTTDADGNEVSLGSSLAHNDGNAGYVENNGTVFWADSSGNIRQITSRNCINGLYEPTATDTLYIDKNNNGIIDSGDISTFSDLII